MAAQKRLEPGSKYASFDKDGDGIVTDEEFEMEQKLIQLENEDKKQECANLEKLKFHKKHL